MCTRAYSGEQVKEIEIKVLRSELSEIDKKAEDCKNRLEHFRGVDAKVVKTLNQAIVYLANAKMWLGLVLRNFSENTDLNKIRDEKEVNEFKKLAEEASQHDGSMTAN